MNLKIGLKALSGKILRKRKLGLAKSYVSLFLCLFLVIGSTAAWFTIRDTAIIKSDTFELESSSSLRVNKGKQISNKIHISDFFLEEASSVDGRNIYFPNSGLSTTNTEDMTFREGNVSDQNIHYVYKDFPLTGTSELTYVYIKSYKIQVETSAGSGEFNEYKDEIDIDYDNNGYPNGQTIPPDCPVRFSFIDDSGRDPKVIDPSAKVIDYVENSDAVDIISNSGVPNTKRTTTDAFASYYYGVGKPIFSLIGNEEKNVTLIIWLEGTAKNMTDDYEGRRIIVDIDIESNFVDMETITFVDDTLPDGNDSHTHWVSDDNPIIALSYKDPYSTEDRYKTVIMKKDRNKQYEWTAEIPKKAVTNISFYRLSPASETDVDQGTVFNSWHTYVGVNSKLSDTAKGFRDANINNGQLQESRVLTNSSGNSYRSVVYTAIHGNGHGAVSHTASDRFSKWLSPCVGYWDYSSGGGQSATEPPTEPGGEVIATKSTINIYAEGFTGNKQWIADDLKSHGYTLKVVFSDNSEYAMSDADNGNYGRLKVEALQIANGLKISHFRMVKDNSVKVLTLTNGEVTINGNWNYTFTIQNDDTMKL